MENLSPTSFAGSRSAWITWEIQVRNRSMAHALGIPLYEVIVNKSRWVKYPTLILKTLKIIHTNKINILFVQNPSIVLSFLAVLVKKLFGIKVIVDAHNSGIYPLEGRNQVLNGIAKFIAKNADCVIISNLHLADVVNGWGGKAFVMSDPIPNLHEISKASQTAPKPYVLFICTWADDEPYLEVIKAAELIKDVDIYVTGNYRKRLSERQLQDLPKNIRLLGFVPEKDYLNYFTNSLAALDLTTRDHCLVCGAYEALALETPGIISDTAVNREVFEQGFIYSKNHAGAIAQSIQQALENQHKLRVDIKLTKDIHQKNTQLKVSALKEKLVTSNF